MRDLSRPSRRLLVSSIRCSQSGHGDTSCRYVAFGNVWGMCRQRASARHGTKQLTSVSTPVSHVSPYQGGGSVACTARTPALSASSWGECVCEQRRFAERLVALADYVSVGELSRVFSELSFPSALNPSFSTISPCLTSFKLVSHTF